MYTKTQWQFSTAYNYNTDDDMIIFIIIIANRPHMMPYCKIWMFSWYAHSSLL